MQLRRVLSTVNRAAFLFLFSASINFFCATGFAMESQFASWMGVFTQGKIDSNWGWYIETQTRLSDSTALDSFLTRGNRLLFRPAVRWLPRGDRTLQVHLGYAWTPHMTPNRNENRLWQQALLQSDGEEWWWMQRVRFEQRWIENTDSVSLRARYFGRIHRYLTPSTKRFGISLWEEIFFHLNSVTGGPVAGFDQCRTFIGPSLRMSQDLRMDVGYLNVYLSQGRSRDSEMLHAALAFIYMEI